MLQVKLVKVVNTGLELSLSYLLLTRSKSVPQHQILSLIHDTMNYTCEGEECRSCCFTAALLLYCCFTVGRSDGSRASACLEPSLSYGLIEVCRNDSS
jgi:hypothetical protein